MPGLLSLVPEVARDDDYTPEAVDRTVEDAEDLSGDFEDWQPEMQTEAEATAEPAPEPKSEWAKRANEPRRAARAAEREAIEAATDMWVTDRIIKVEDTYIVPTTTIYADFNDYYRHIIGFGELKPYALGRALTRAGFKPSKPHWGPYDEGGKFKSVAAYRGVKLKPREEKAEQPAEPVAEPVQVEEPVDPAEATANIQAALADLKAKAEPRVVHRGYRYTGPRPGREMKDDKYREYVNAVLDSEPGWEYDPNGNGGKPKLRNPEGRKYTLANTPSDVRGFMFMRTQLRTRLGAKV